jgi:hypothetical protein
LLKSFLKSFFIKRPEIIFTGKKIISVFNEKNETLHQIVRKIVYSKEFNTRAEAMREEKKLKSFKNRKFLEQYCGLISERLLAPKRI